MIKHLAIRPLMVIAAFVAGFAGVTGPTPPAGTTYYVSPTGMDANPGTRRLPFRTIQQAVDAVAPGDGVIVEDGTYSGIGTGTPCASRTSRPIVCVTRGGTERAWITIRARRKGGARLDGQNNASTEGFRFLRDANYITLDGFEIFGVGNADQSGTGIELDSGGHDVVISGNHIHDIGRLCTDSRNGQTGMFVAQPRVTISGNVFHDIGRFAPGENGCKPDTLFYQNHDHGIYLNGNRPPGGSDAIIANNVFYNHRRGWAIQVYPGTIAGLSILNNTFATPNPYHTGHVLLGAVTSNGRIVNNIFDSPQSAAITFYERKHTNLMIANNLTTERLADAAPDGVSIYNNLEHTDAQLDRDFRPTSASFAIDRGLQLREVATDLLGRSRMINKPWDIGAYEFERLRH